MKLPPTVDSNILSVYHENDDHETVHMVGTDCRLRCDDLQWDVKHVARLSHLCIAVIAENWSNAPVSELPLERDMQELLRALPSPHPHLVHPHPNQHLAPLDVSSTLSQSSLAALVTHVHCDTFWERACRSRWVGESRPFLQRYLERHMEDYLTHLLPTEYDPEKISELVSVCGERVQRMVVKRLRAGGFSQERDAPNTYREMIPLGSVLSGLPQLSELHLSLALVAPSYCRSLYRLSPQNARRLAAGLRHCRLLSVLRITRSDIDCAKLKVVLDSLWEHEHVRLLELSHCHVADQGALHLSAFLLQRPSLRELLLVNNNIGAQGAAAIGYALVQPSCRLLVLDLRCNTSLRAAGLAVLAAALHKGTPLHRLNVSACGVGATGESGVEAGRLLAAALAAGRSPLRELDISVNNLGSETGCALLAALQVRGSGGPSVLIARAARLGRWEGVLARYTLRTAARRRAAALRFRRGAARLLQAKRVAKAIGIGEVDPLQLARQLTARPSAASLPLSLSLSLSVDALDEGAHAMVDREVLQVDVPVLKNPFAAPGLGEGGVAPRRPSYHGQERQGRGTLPRGNSVDSALGRHTEE